MELTSETGIDEVAFAAIFSSKLTFGSTNSAPGKSSFVDNSLVRSRKDNARADEPAFSVR